MPKDLIARAAVTIHGPAEQVRSALVSPEAIQQYVVRTTVTSLLFADARAGYCSVMNKPPPAEPLLLSMLGAAHAVEARLDAALAEVGLSLAKAGVLALLARARSPLPLSDLAEHRKCVRSNITQLVDRLEQDGLVRRQADPTDRRGVQAVLTPAGTRAHEKAQEVLGRAHRAILEGLSSSDAARLKTLLGVLRG